MSAPVRVGVVGAGLMSQLAHLANYQQIPGCRLTALAELRPELRRRVAERYGIPRSYPSHRELLADAEVDAVVVVTPRRATGPVALECLEAGKHVLTEKPMASTVEQAERLVSAAQAHGVRYAVGYMRRHDEGVECAKRLMDDVLRRGDLGPVIFARAHCFMGEGYANIDGQITTTEPVGDAMPEWPMAPAWVPQERQADYAGFLNVYCHTVNLLRYLMGRTPSVDYAQFERADGRVAVLDFGEWRAVLEAGRFTSRGWDESLEIYFAHGRLRVVLPPAMLRNVPATVELYQGGSIQQVQAPQCGWSWAFRRQAEAFVRDVQEGREPLAGGQDALDDMRLIDDLWRAALREPKAALVASS